MLLSSDMNEPSVRLKSHANRDEYQEAINLLMNLDVISESLEQCLRIDLPRDTTESSIYLGFAISLQTYFVNAQGLNNSLTWQDAPSSRLKGMISIARIIRNKVAHQGIWLPSNSRRNPLEKGSFAYFGLPLSELKSLLLKQSLTDKKRLLAKQLSQMSEASNVLGSDTFVSHANDLDSWTQDALALLDSDYSSPYFDVVPFMKHHYIEYVPWVLAVYTELLEDEAWAQVADLRNQVDLCTLEERLAALDTKYNKIVSIMRHVLSGF